jgi:F0F1-type ATP synthase assembly protein I
MAKSEVSKADKKAARAARRQAAKEQRGQMWQALKIQSKQDKLLWPLMIGAVVLSTVVFFLLGMLWGGQWWMLPLGLLVGVMLAMLVFSRRVQNTVYERAEGQPGAAAWALDQLRSGWRVNQAVAATTSFDAVHRVVGRCGIVLVGEGQPHRLKPLMTQEKKKIARIVGDTPIYELIVGDEEGASPEQVPLRKLTRRLTRYPMNIDRAKVDALDGRLRALSTKTGIQNQMPKGPLPQGAKVRNMQRSARRRG